MKKVIIPSPAFKNVAVIWDEIDGSPKIIRIMLSHPNLPASARAVKLFPKAKNGSCPKIDSFCKTIKKFLNGEKISFSLDILNLKQCTPFQRSVLKACFKIPRGSVSTYQLLAKKIGNPNAARAVGNTMAKNPFPLIIPCHRVIASNQTLGGFQCGLKMKHALLKNEGFCLTETPRPYGRGFSECKLRLSIVFLTLILDVISHGFFAHAYC